MANESDAFPDDPTRTALPTIQITSPASLSTVGSTPVTVSGTVDPSAVGVTVNGSSVSIVGDAFSAEVSLEEGHNTIEARMVDSGGIVSTDAVSVSLDMTPPYITVDSHSDGQKVYASPITVTGLVNDIVRGTIEESEAEVTVNGVTASIANRSYAASGVALTPGTNQIQVVASDQVGNTESLTIDLDYAPPAGKRIELVSGDGQTADTGTLLASPLVVRVLDDASQPVASANVAFRVAQGAGLLGATSGDEARAVLVTTGANGEAQSWFRLGSRAGVANHKVRARVVGYDDEVVFSASAEGDLGNKVSISSGNNQRGGIHQPVPAPLVVSVTDEGSNVVSGAEVEFLVVSGGGHFPGEGSSFIATTDSDGRASIDFVLGGAVGLDQQVVKASLLDKAESVSDQEVSASFTLSGLESGDPGDTTISGTVLDNQSNPVPGVTVRVTGTTREAVADVAGRFIITQAPVGPVHLVADGSTATVEGEFPSLGYDLVTVSGADNPLPAPIYMVKLNLENAVYAGLEDVEITLPEVPGFKLSIAAGSVTFPDGSTEGSVSVTAVNASAVPMPPPNGMQPQFIVTIQPTGAMFDPPAGLTLPNVDGFSPGEQVEM